MVAVGSTGPLVLGYSTTVERTPSPVAVVELGTSIVEIVYTVEAAAGGGVGAGVGVGAGRRCGCWNGLVIAPTSVKRKGYREENAGKGREPHD
jgi:hypothetical protein